MRNDFVDFYEVLQVSQRADPLTISRVYRHLAKIYHPDNQESGDRKMFDQLTEGLETLTNARSAASSGRPRPIAAAAIIGSIALSRAVPPAIANGTPASFSLLGNAVGSNFAYALRLSPGAARLNGSTSVNTTGWSQ